MYLNNYQYLKNKETSLLIFLFLFSFFIRIPSIFVFGDLNLENEWYFLADNLQNHGKLSMRNFGDFFVPNLFMPPLYAYYLYFFKIFNLNNETYVQLILFSQIALSSFSVIIFYFINKFFFSTKISLFGALMFSIFPLHIYACGQISSIILQSFLTVVFIYLLFITSQKNNYSNIFLLSLVSGLLILLRGEFIALFVLSIVYLKIFLKTNFKSILIILLLVSVVVSPYVARNVFVAETLTITKSIGFNLWKGNNENAKVEGNSQYDLNMKNKIDNLAKDNNYDAKLDNIFLDEALKNIKTNPTKYAILYLKKFLSFIFIDIDSSYPNYYHPLNYLPALLFGILSIVGIILSDKNSYQMNFLILFFIANVVIFSSFFILPRYKLVILPMQIIFINILIDYFKAKFITNNE